MIISMSSFLLFFLSVRQPPSSTLFPYTTLFRSRCVQISTPVTSNASSTTEISTLARLPMVDQLPSWSRRGQLRGSAERPSRSEEHTSELQSHVNLVCRLLLEKKKKQYINNTLDN